MLCKEIPLETGSVGYYPQLMLGFLSPAMEPGSSPACCALVALNEARDYSKTVIAPLGIIRLSDGTSFSRLLWGCF